MSGSIAVRYGPDNVEFIKNKSTEHELADWLSGWEDFNTHAYIERVHSMPKQGVASSFKFGQSYGFLRGILIALQIPFEEVQPVKWQTALSCRTGGDKKISRAKAQQLFPHVDITDANADAILIAEYCMRMRT